MIIYLRDRITLITLIFFLSIFCLRNFYIYFLAKKKNLIWLDTDLYNFVICIIKSI